MQAVRAEVLAAGVKKLNEAQVSQQVYYCLCSACVVLTVYRRCALLCLVTDGNMLHCKSAQEISCSELCDAESGSIDLLGPRLERIDACTGSRIITGGNK